MQDLRHIALNKVRAADLPQRMSLTVRAVHTISLPLFLISTWAPRRPAYLRSVTVLLGLAVVYS